MTYRDLMENHADVVYHTAAAALGLAGFVVAIVALVRYLSHGTVDTGLWGIFGGLSTLAGTFMAGGIGNARLNPNNS